MRPGAVPVRSGCVAAGVLFIALLMIMAGLAMMVRSRFVMGSCLMVSHASQPSDLGHMPPIAAHLFAAPAADFRHMLAILAYRLAAFASSLSMALGVAVPAATFAAILPTTLSASTLLTIVVVLVALTASARMLLARSTTLRICHFRSFPFRRRPGRRPSGLL